MADLLGAMMDIGKLQIATYPIIESLMDRYSLTVDDVDILTTPNLDLSRVCIVNRPVSGSAPHLTPVLEP